MWPRLSGIDYNFSVVGADELNGAMNNIVTSCESAQRRLRRPEEHGCHYCGNPDPGDKCRYCGVASVRSYTVQWQVSLDGKNWHDMRVR